MKPLFIASQAGQLFCGFYPALNQTVDRAILHIPAFAEEMNKSRRMVALQAQAFASLGYSVLVLDLYGTGDSEGDFGEATWHIWLQNIEAAIAWLRQQGTETISLWGLRIGALLAMDFASRSPYPITHLIAWQPVINGDTFISQFLRLRVVATIMDNNAPRGKTAELKQQLLSGQSIEVAGYCLNSELVKPLITLRADQLPWQAVKEMAIFEVVSSVDNPVAIGNTPLLSILQEQNINASLTKVVGEAFWASQEISEAPDLIKITTERVEQWP